MRNTIFITRMIFLVVIFISFYSIQVQAEPQPQTEAQPQAQAEAQRQPSRFYGKVGFGAYFPKSDTLKDNLDTGYSVDLAGGYFFHPNIGVELDIGINETKVPVYAYFGKTDMQVGVVPITLNLVLSSPRTNDLKAFIKAGVGYYFIDWTPPLHDAKSEWVLGYQIGFGVSYKFIGMEAKYLIAKENEPNMFPYDKVKMDFSGFVVNLMIGFF
jgi:opacity protein-like surface antigen